MLKNLVRKAYADKFKRYLIIILVITGILISIREFYLPNKTDSDSEFHFFFHPLCPHCKEQMPFNDYLEKEYGIELVYHDVTKPSEMELFKQYAAGAGILLQNLAVPGTFFSDAHFIGFIDKETTGVEIEEAIKQYISSSNNKTKQEGKIDEEGFNPVVKLPLFGEINVTDYSLPVLAIILGLVDGFNPCAMWVLVFLISLIVSLNERKKIWLLVGSFVFASGVLYFFFMTAWLQAYLFIGYQGYLTLIIGLFALYVGIVDLRTYFKTKGALACEVGDAEGKKKTMSRIEKIVKSPLTLMSLFGIIALAFIVNSVEFMCSFFLPAIFTQVLSISNISGFGYYWYILLYVFFFMLDDLVIFGLAAFALNTKYGDRYAKYCKLIGGAVLLLLGIVMVFAPQWLR